ncbi:hypothetical protein PFDG_02968 [Plasmodium falciparum Dd2]|uniref:Uncharacterized protein n=1 Tax=Plasmodium falciparum (isolate Dd2) TaxID=57267 RepID=A0A0L7M390_PLAF4|nr:hypothetical protein PFDG_02968 [Plasmodium falciparum Dd2]
MLLLYISFLKKKGKKKKKNSLIYFRMSTRTSLIKKDFFCKKTIAQLEVQMNDAESCGFIFRIVGERNYWSLMIDKKVLKLAHVKDGELIILKEFKELKIKNDQWYVLFVQEILKDIKIKAGIYGDLSVEYLRKSDDETDYNENKQIMRGKKWSNEYEKFKKKNQGSLLYNIEDIEKLYDNTKGEFITTEQKKKKKIYIYIYIYIFIYLFIFMNYYFEFPFFNPDWCPNAALCSKKKYEINDF